MWTDDGLAIIIEGKREDWPGGPRTLTPRASGLEPNGRTLWYGAELNPDGRQVWFRITADAAGQLRTAPGRFSGGGAGGGAGFRSSPPATSERDHSTR